MARELSIRITADDSAARGPLTRTEQGLKKVEGSAKSADTAVAGASANVRSLGDSAQAVSNKMSAAVPVVTRFAGAFGLMIGAGAGAAVVGFVKSAIGMAENVKDLSDKLGVSTTKVQQWSFAVEQSGGSMQNIETALSFMNKTLGAGDKGTIRMLSMLGLEFSAIRAMKPEDAFESIVRAVSKIPDPMLQARAMTELFGRSGQDLLPAIRNNFLGVAESARTMSEDTIKRLDAAKDALESFKRTLIIWSGEIVGAFARDIPAAMSGWSKFFGDVKATLTGGVEGHRKYIQTLQDQAMAEQNAAKAGEVAKAKLRENSAAMLKAAEAAERKAKADEEAAKQAIAHAKAIQQQADVLTGMKLAREMTDMATAVKLAQQQGGIFTAELPKLVKQIDEWARAGAKVPPTLLDIRKKNSDLLGPIATVGNAFENYTKTLKNHWFEVERVGDEYLDVSAKFKHFNSEIVTSLTGFLNKTAVVTGKEIREMAEEIQNRVGLIEGAFRDAFDRMGESVSFSFASMLTGAQGFKDGFVGIWHAIKASIINILADILQAFVGNFLRGMISAMSGGGFGRSFAGMFSGIGGLFGGAGSAAVPGLAMSGINAGGGFAGGFGASGAAAGGGGGMGAIGAFFTNPFTIGIGAALAGGLALWNRQRNVTKGSREDFAKELGFGNLGGLYEHLQGMGAGGEALAHQGLNVIGRKDTAANTKWMDDVLKFLDEADQKTKRLASDTQELGLTWEDLGQQARAAKLDETAENLFEQTQRLVKEGYEYDRVIGKQAQSYSYLYSRAREFGERLPATLQPVLEKLAGMSLLVDANGNKITELAEDMFDAAKSIQDSWDGVRRSVENSAGAVDEYGRRINTLPVGPRYELEGAETEGIPSFADRPLERVTKAGLVMTHPGDVVGVPKGLGGGVTVNLTYDAKGSIYRGDRRSAREFAEAIASELTHVLNNANT